MNTPTLAHSSFRQLNAREKESLRAARCLDVALGVLSQAATRQDASLFRYASMTFSTSHPLLADRLFSVSQDYFARHGGNPYSFAEMQSLKMISDMPRLKHSLENELKARKR